MSTKHSPLELAASEYLKSDDAVGRHLKTCVLCRGENPSSRCSEGMRVFKERSHAYSEMSRHAFAMGLR